MKKIDVYIIRKFLTTYFISIVLILSIAVVFDFSEKIDNFIDHSAPLNLILKDYYLNFIIHYGTIFSGLLTFISVIFFTSRMSENSEIIAFYNSKISPHRLFLPYLICAIIIFSPCILLTNFLIPKTNEKRLNFENKYIKKSDWRKLKNFNKSIKKNSIIYMNYYDIHKKEGWWYCFQKINKLKLEKTIKSKLIEWDKQKLKWKIIDYRIDSFIYNKKNENIKVVTTINKGDLYIDLNEDPNKIFKQKREIQSMDTQSLSKLIKEEKESGNNDLKLEIIEKTQRFSAPFSIIILTLLGFSISIRKNKGGLGLKLSFGILACFTYIFLMKFSTTLTLNGDFSPALAIWMPNLLFGIISILSFKKLAY